MADGHPYEVQKNGEECENKIGWRAIGDRPYGCGGGRLEQAPALRRDETLLLANIAKTGRGIMLEVCIDGKQ